MHQVQTRRRSLSPPGGMSIGEGETTSSPPLEPQKENMSPKSEAEVEGKRRIYTGRIAKALIAYKPMTARKILNPPVPQVVKPMDRQEKNCQSLSQEGIDEVLMLIPLKKSTGCNSHMRHLRNRTRQLNGRPAGSETRSQRGTKTPNPSRQTPRDLPGTRTVGHDEIGRSKK